MKMTKSLTCTLAATAIAASAAFAPVANAEVSASVGVANMYLWRGYDLGDGSAAVSGDITVSGAGFYAGIWGTSGDDSLGSEYDLYVGWGGEFGPVSVDLSVLSYVYPDATYDTLIDPLFAYIPARDDTVGDLSEAILSVGIGPVAVTYYDNIAGGPGYSYYTIAGSIGDFGILVGQHHNDGGENDDPVHLDLSYSYNDNLSFTISKFIEDEEGVDDNMQFLVSYSLPIE
ncbi:TorF family putative porin [Aurantivibrio plasticivorans]